MVPGCSTNELAKGYCSFHYNRHLTGVPLDAPLKGKWDTVVGPAGMHHRLRAIWGPAANHPCVEDCGWMAQDWAYDGTDPEASLGRTGTWKGIWYSLYPEFYMPLCRKCHRTRDRLRAAAELHEYRRWKSQTGLSLGQVS